MVLSLVPSVFAADEPTITMSADKTEVAPSETVTLTLSIDQAFDADAVGFEISFDNAAYTLTSAKNCQASGATRLIFTNTDVANNSGRVAATYLQTGFDKMILTTPVGRQRIGHPLLSPQKKVWTPLRRNLP